MDDVQASIEALQWYIDHDLAFPMEEEPVDRFKPIVVPSAPAAGHAGAGAERETVSVAQILGNPDNAPTAAPAQQKKSAADIAGSAAAIAEAKKIAEQCDTIEALREAIQNFKGIGIKSTATNMVFSDGNPEADIMVIADVPGNDEDRSGKPFSGTAGGLLDKMFASIGRSRSGDTPENSIYLSSILNWRPPGMRSAESSEVEASLPFIERHIMLAKPKMIICIGGAPYKILMDETVKIMKDSGKVEDYKPRVLGDDGLARSLTAFLSPDYLMNNPLSKKRAWHDLLKIKALLDN